MKLEDRVALVTGGSSGIGLAVAKAFVARRMRVAIVGRSAERLAAAVQTLGSDRVLAVALDVRDRAGGAQLPGRVVAHFGQLDVLVHSAGANHRGPFASKRVEELAEIVETNLVAPMLLTHAALPYLGKGSAVVSVASLAGKVPLPHEAAYSASKAGLRALSRALEVELRGLGVAVSTICPGPVDTAFLGDAAEVPDIVFSQPMSTADRVAEAVVDALESGRSEIDLPMLSGKLATLGYLSPAFLAALRPLLERRGARNKQRYLSRRG